MSLDIFSSSVLPAGVCEESSALASWEIRAGAGAGKASQAEISARLWLFRKSFNGFIAFQTDLVNYLFVLFIYGHPKVEPFI